MHIDLTPYHLVRPEKVRWRFPQKSPNVLENIKSKGLRNFLRNVDELLAEQKITWEYRPVSETDFAEWLKYYHSKMEEHHFDILASMDWYRGCIAIGKKVEGTFFYQHGKLIGSSIITREGEQKAILAYKATERMEISTKRNGSIGAVVDYFFLKMMMEQHVPIISSGRSRNAFGVINTLGYLDYKLRFGYEPTLAPDQPELTTIPVAENGVVLFFAMVDQHFTLHALVPANSQEQFEQARFASPEMPFVILRYEPSALLPDS